VADKRGKARFMVLAVEPGFTPSLKGSLQGKIKEIVMRTRLDAYTINDLFGRTRLVFQEKVIPEEWEIGVDGEIALAEVNKYGNLKNGIRVEVNQLNLIMMEKAAKEFVGGETESSLEEGGQHHDLVGVRSGDFFILGWPPLEDGTVRKKMFLYSLDELILIDEGWFQLLRVRGRHGTGGGTLGEESSVQRKKMECAKREKKWRRQRSV
jgi:hypothetical protein